MATLRTKKPYMDLIAGFPLRPIRSDRELSKAIKVIDGLLDRGTLGSDEADYLEVLSDLVERYETAQRSNDKPLSDAQVLAHLMEAKGVGQTAIAKATGIVNSSISEVLSGKRKLNRNQIGKLATYFHVSPGVFVFDS